MSVHLEFNFMRTLISFFIVLICASVADAEEADGLIQRNGMTRITAEKIQFTTNETMGLLGVNYLIETVPNLYLGGAAYGALTGQRGGFFTIGSELAWHQKFNDVWAWEMGLYAGGGGGSSANAQVGGGLMLRPHIDLFRNVDGHRVGISMSQVRFPTGSIRSNQVGLVLASDTDFLEYGDAANTTSKSRRGGVGFDRVHAVVGSYQGQILSPGGGKKTVGLVGFRMEQRYRENMFWGIEAAGAATGGIAGYAEFLGTAGIETSVLQGDVVLAGRLAAGMGGGGAASVGGGQLYKAGGVATLNLSRSTHAALEAGYAAAPTGRMRTRYVAANLTLDLDHPFSSDTTPQIDHYEFLLGSNRYLHTAHKNGSVNAMDVLTLTINRYLTDNIYLSGQAHSAFAGKNEGGFSAGLFGLGWRSQPINEKLRVGAEMLLGAAGGGAVDSSGGAIIAPSVYLDWQLNPLFTMRLASSRIKSVNGALNTQTAEAAIKFSYATMSR
jgi:hypothetical protein